MASTSVLLHTWWSDRDWTTRTDREGLSIGPSSRTRHESNVCGRGSLVLRLPLCDPHSGLCAGRAPGDRGRWRRCVDQGGNGLVTATQC